MCGIRSFSRAPGAYCWILLSALVVSGPERLKAQELAPVQNLQCDCLPVPEVGFQIRLQWDNPILYDQIVITLDGRAPLPLPGATNMFQFDLPVEEAGPHILLVQGFRGPEFSPEEMCAVECIELPVDDPVPMVQSPPQAMLNSTTGVAEVMVDAFGSVDSFGGRALRYLWQTAGGVPDPDVEIENPQRSVTRIRFRRPDTFEIELQISGVPDFGKVQSQTFTIEVITEDAAAPGPPSVLPPHPAFLTVVGGRSLDTVIALANSQPPTRFALVDPPPGLAIDALTGRLFWETALADSRAEYTVRVEVTNDLGTTLEEFPVRVLDPGQPVGLFGTRTDEVAEAGAGDGAAAALQSAPAELTDRSAFDPPHDMFLYLGEAPECAVQNIVPDDPGVPDGDRFAGIRFQPACGDPDPGGPDGDDGDGAAAAIAPPPPGTGGVYFSGSSATSFVLSVNLSFSVELWLSNVPTVQVDSPANVFSLAEAGSGGGVNWEVTYAGGSYSATMRSDQGDLTLSTAADFSDSEPHHLVYVRDGDTHRLYVDGVEQVETVAAGAPSWSDDYEFFLGNTWALDAAFTGDVLLSAAYPSALDQAMIDVLFDLGPLIPTDADIPAPVAEICPDPREVNRGSAEADGTQSAPGIGGGDGAAASISDCPTLLRPLEWSVSGDDPAQVLDWSSRAGHEECHGIVDIDFVFPTTEFDLTVTLTAKQVPVRGIEKEDTVVATITLPTPDMRRGAVNDDAIVDVSDALLILFYLIGDVPAPNCLKAADANDDGRIDATDTVYLLNYLFLRGLAPPAPFAECGLDPTADALTCESASCS